MPAQHPGTEQQAQHEARRQLGRQQRRPGAPAHVGLQLAAGEPHSPASPAVAAGRAALMRAYTMEGAAAQAPSEPNLEPAPPQPATPPAQPQPSAQPQPKKQCANCGAAGGDGVKLRRCAGCRRTRYCSAECQAAHWPEHKLICAAQRE